jgi:hypothetical protein
MDVPFRARVQYFTDTKPFTAAATAVALLSFGVLLLGMAFWRIRWILVRDKDDKDYEDHRDIRNATLRRHGVFAGSLTVVVIVILALSSLPKGGHPPLVAIVLIYAIPIVCALWLGICFLVARHLVETRQADRR